jgi:hypothetical protein
LALLNSSPTLCGAEEIAPFRLIGAEGYASMRYLGDTVTGTQPGNRSRQTQSDLREEVFLMTHSYAYHPNFVTLDIGGGPILQHGRFSGDSGEASSSGTLYNLATRATFLRDKPYRGSLFFDHLNPTLAIAPGSIMTQENTRYGFDFSMLAPLPVSVDATRSRTQGSSVDRSLDDQIDQFNLTASQPIGALGVTQFRYQSSQQESMSGSPNLPVQRTNFDRENYQLDTRLRFGTRNEYDLFNLAMLDRQAFGLGGGVLPQRRDRRFLLDLRGRHSQQLNSFATYAYGATDQGFLSSNMNAASAGFTYSPSADLSLGAGTRAEDSRTTSLTARAWGVDGSVQRRLPLGPGLLSASYSVRYDQRDRQASAARADVIGERQTLAGTAAVALSQPRVISGSIVVSDIARTQTFVEGIDYIVTVVGLQTRLQRLVGGNILDGQEVLADYAFETEGSFANTQTDQTLSVSWGLAQYFNVYLRYLDSAPHLTSGTPTTPLNTVHSALYGTSVDVPLNRAADLTLGGLYEYEQRSETIAPYRRRMYEFHAQTDDPVFSRGNLRISTRRLTQDFEGSSQNVRLHGYDLRWSSRPPIGMEISATASYERDTGGLLPRTRQLATAGARWRYRQAQLVADFTRLRETQGEFERYRTVAQLLLRRDF